MNYSDAEKHLLKRRPRISEALNESDREDDNYHDNQEVARNVVILSIARNLERIANALEKQ